MLVIYFFFFFNDTATTEIYTLSLHDALPIFAVAGGTGGRGAGDAGPPPRLRCRDRKSTRLNSSHLVISYAVFCLKKKNYRLLHCHLEDANVCDPILLTDMTLRRLP